MRSQLAMIVCILCQAALMTGCGRSVPKETLAVGSSSPALKLKKALGGSEVSLESLKGEQVVINFWSTGCAVCMQELEDLNQIEGSGKVKVLGIALDEDRESILRVIERREINYPILLGNQEIFEQFDGYSIPYTIVLDRAHVVVKRFFGRMSEEDLNEVLDSSTTTEKLAINQ